MIRQQVCERRRVLRQDVREPERVRTRRRDPLTAALLHSVVAIAALTCVYDLLSRSGRIVKVVSV
ncbi:hypothetical protein GQ600_16126 [Phytophthora cactorum]|nr:hypothetical protein GQ600_16126 [Phytophthora cactorum]